MGFTFTFPFWGKHCSLRFQCPDNIRKLHIANMQFCKSFLQKNCDKKTGSPHATGFTHECYSLYEMIIACPPGIFKGSFAQDLA